MLLIISKVLIIFVYIGIGLAAQRMKLMPKGSTKVITALIMEITMPCMLVSSITGQTVDHSMRLNTVITLVLTSMIYMIVAIVSTFISDRAFTGLEQQDRNVLASSMTGCNSGFMGFPVARSVFGTQAFYYMVIQNISNNIYLFFMSYAQLHHREKGQNASVNLREMLKPMANSTTAVTIVSIILLFAGIKLPGFAMDIFTTVGDITVPLSMIMVGIQLGQSDFRKVIRSKEILISSAIKLVVAPALVVVLLIPLPVDPIVKLTALLGTCFPSAVVGVAVADRENKNSRLMAEAVAASTLLSMLTLPVWIMICGYLYL